MSASAPFLQVASVGVALGEFSLEDVSLSCAAGEYHILLGPTGSGKTSLLRCLLGLQRPKADLCGEFTSILSQTVKIQT